MTWFFCLRYYTTLANKYPELTTQGILWFKDITTYDPYCILPIASSIFSYYNIAVNILIKLSPNINS